MNDGLMGWDGFGCTVHIASAACDVLLAGPGVCACIVLFLAFYAFLYFSIFFWLRAMMCGVYMYIYMHGNGKGL